MSADEDRRSFRIVAGAWELEAVKNFLKAEGFIFKNEPFSPYCHQFITAPFSPGSSLAAFFGYIYIQDRSSMLPPLAINPASGTAILDMCASPGSKTGFLAQLTGETGFVLANEPNPSRFATLRTNLSRLNLLNTGLCKYNGYGLPFPESSIESILLDPPCSGWGTVEKNPKVKKIWKRENVTTLVQIQKHLLAKAALILKPCGKLLYSTCTTNPAENEEQIANAIGKLPLELYPLEPFEGFIFDKELLRQGMLLVDGESSKSQGFFLALLKKSGQSSTPPSLQAIRESPCINRCGKDVHLPIPCPENGTAKLYGTTVRYLSESGERFIPERLVWEAPALGSYSKNYAFRPNFRLRYRSLMEFLPAIKINDVQKIRELLSGRVLETHLSDNLAGLWWENLPLGLVAIKKHRIIHAFH